MLVMVTWLKTLVALIAKVRLRRVSPNRKERFMLAFTAVRNRPGIVSRPAFPNWPTGGVVNASGLKEAAPIPAMGIPVASARRFPEPASPPVLERLPETYAVKGVPVRSEERRVDLGGRRIIKKKKT